MKDKILALLKKTKISILQIALGVGAVLCIVITLPQLFNVGKVISEVNDKKRILNELDRNIKNLENSKKELEILEKEYKDFIARLPAQREFSIFLELLSRLAKKNGVKIIAMEPQTVIESPNLFFLKIPIYIDASCSYHELARFINELEYSNNLIKVEDIKISSEESDEILQHQVFLNVHAFCLKDEIYEKLIF
ncbi:MAG: type 4a pilus biogenesis protein PilO [Candidatus Omnitrophota bacterium]